MNRTSLLIIFAMFLSATALAAIPNIMNLQGRLTDAGGVALNGTQNFTLRIYDAYTDGDTINSAQRNALL